MLGEFHQQAKSDGKACHATYILSGFIEEAVPTNDAMQIDGDDYLMSSQPVPTQESSTSNVARTKMIRTVTLVDEDGVYGETKSISLILDSKSRFSELTSIHVYSLGPAAVRVRSW
jgi:hypothetical protein